MKNNLNVKTQREASIHNEKQTLGFNKSLINIQVSKEDEVYLSRKNLKEVN